LPLVQAEYRRNKPDNQLIDTLKTMYNNEVISSYDAKTIETVKDGMFYKLTLEVTTQDGILKFSPNIIKEQGVWGINPTSAYLKPIN
jgi:hypothetical protein